ncbi:unnamed protein product [Nippostrongylus brasiliensis]|uniref:Reverse transcriptase domain-containing protein n=1 Tax=Nippostrongylus brasiliensis TaxID=27835 RepID=A0A0N4XHI3_NIPBR|nr:unnamed protein product [Nippostrongylus brasiliensis]
MQTLQWDDIVVKINGLQLHHLRFADDIVLVTPSITQAERTLADLDRACRKIGLELNLPMTMFLGNGYVSDASTERISPSAPAMCTWVGEST